MFGKGMGKMEAIDTEKVMGESRSQRIGVSLDDKSQFFSFG
jgi:hypothetical protein